MQIHRVGYQVRGFWKLNDYAIRYVRMVTNEAKQRAKILSFWEKHGLEATKEAFEIGRSTLFKWKKMQETGEGRMESLNPGSKRPKQVRHRDWPDAVKSEIRRLRTDHPNLGKEKIHIFLKRFCDARKLSCPKPRTIGRLIADAPDKMRMFPVKIRHNGQIVPKKRTKRLRKPKQFKADHPGHCISFDTVELIVHYSRKYVITFTDVYSHFSFAFATTSHASQAAADFFKVVRALFPYRLEYILTDNGSEFMKHFDEELRRLCLTHWHTYPKTPKMNAHCERFNRTIQEEYINYHKGEMINLHRFNLNMFDWLVWYNAERPHWSLNLQSPIQFLTEWNKGKSRMYWPDTETCQSPLFLLFWLQIALGGAF